LIFRADVFYRERAKKAAWAGCFPERPPGIFRKKKSEFKAFTAFDASSRSQGCPAQATGRA
jgi:hypothetical protein